MLTHVFVENVCFDARFLDRFYESLQAIDQLVFRAR